MSSKPDRQSYDEDEEVTSPGKGGQDGTSSQRGQSGKTDRDNDEMEEPNSGRGRGIE